MHLLGALHYIENNPQDFKDALTQHIRLSVSALLVAMALFIPMGVFTAASRRYGQTIIAAIATVRVMPSLVVVFLMLPLVGIGFTPALIALILLAGPPLVINTDAGLRGVDPATREAARGLGMNAVQSFVRVQLPLALPVIVAGIRSATVEVIASATLGAFIGAGGLGNLILTGVSMLDWSVLLAGAIPVTLLALFAEAALAGVEHLITPPAG